MPAQELHQKLIELGTDQVLEELKRVNSTLKFGDTATVAGITAAVSAFFPYYSLAAALVVHASSKPIIDKIALLNTKLREHFQTILEAIPEQWSILDLTSSIRGKEMLGYLLALNPPSVVLDPLAKFDSKDMNQDFVNTICHPVGIVPVNGKLALTATRAEGESSWQYFARMQGRMSTEVTRTLYGSNKGGGHTTTNAVFDATRSLATVPFRVGETVVSGAVNGTMFLYNGVTGIFSKGTTPPTPTQTTTKNEYNDDDDEDDVAEELKQMTLDQHHDAQKEEELVVARSSSKSPTRKK